ncbi:MAG: DUF5050 domain-containing protein, partial [Marinisporobacter sp.]|nr:DUF5050 domain-containing protein [Marinisporobacter sp.]
MKKSSKCCIALVLIVCMLLGISVSEGNHVYAAMEGKIYYSQGDPSYDVKMANSTDGSGATLVYKSPAGTPEAVAVDLNGGYIYYADRHPSNLSESKIYRANFDGSGAITLIAGVKANSIAIDSIHGKIYYSQGDPNYNVVMANLSDGSGATPVYTSPAGTPEAVAVDPIGGHIYYADRHPSNLSESKIYRANLDGSEATTFIAGVKVNSIAIDSIHGKIYYVDKNTYSIKRANLSDGSGATPVYTSPAGTPEAVAVDPNEGYIYYTDRHPSNLSESKICRENLDGSGAITLITGVKANSIAIPFQIVVQAAPEASSVSISGTAQVGEILTGNYNYNDVNGDTEGASTFKWYRSDDVSGTNKTEISGATSKTYELKNTELGKYISFEVTPVASSGTSPGSAVESRVTGKVVAAEAAPVASSVSNRGT